MDSENILTNSKLRELFPQYKEEIEQLQKEMACGCSLCVWLRLKAKYPKSKLPKKIYACV